MCIELRGSGIAPLLIKDPIRALRLKVSWQVLTNMGDPLQPWHRGHGSTGNYLLAEESGTEERGNNPHTPGIVKFEVVSCCWDLWRISRPHKQPFSMGPPIFG